MAVLAEYSPACASRVAIRTGDDIPGFCAWEDSETEQIRILVERGDLRLWKTGRVGRRLARMGTGQYHPAGALEVRILIDNPGGPAQHLTLRDSTMAMVAARKQQWLDIVWSIAQVIVSNEPFGQAAIKSRAGRTGPC